MRPICPLETGESLHRAHCPRSLPRALTPIHGPPPRYMRLRSHRKGQTQTKQPPHRHGFSHAFVGHHPRHSQRPCCTMSPNPLCVPETSAPPNRGPVLLEPLRMLIVCPWRQASVSKFDMCLYRPLGLKDMSCAPLNFPNIAGD